MRIKTVIMTCALVLLTTVVAFAEPAELEHEGLPWGNFALRLVNILIFLGIIWYAAGGLIKKYFVGRRASIITEMEELDRLKKEAAAHLADVERRVAGVEAEAKALLEEGALRLNSSRPPFWPMPNARLLISWSRPVAARNRKARPNWTPSAPAWRTTLWRPWKRGLLTGSTRPRSRS